MTENTPAPPNDTPAGQRYADEQSVGALLISCAPHQRAVLGILAIADLHGLDPAPMLSSLGIELPSLYRYRTQRLAELMSEGSSADEALVQLPGLLPPAVVLALDLAREQGKTREFYSFVLDRTPENDVRATSDDDNGFGDLIGLGFKVLVVVYFVSFIMLKVVPEFSKMLQEFGVELPDTMRLLMVTADRLVSVWFLMPLVLLALTPFFMPSIRRYLRRWNPFTWRQPEIFPASTRRQTLAVATQSDSQPSSVVARVLDRLPFMRSFKGLKKAQAKIEAGSEGWESLASEKIISKHEAKALALASSGETRTWLLNWSATKQQNRFSSRMANRTRTTVVVVNIGLTFIVALSAIAIFSTLIAIMESMY